MDLEAVWAHREDVVYPEMFGQESRGIFPLSQNAFQPFPGAQIDPRWMHYGVFEFAPTEGRGSWLYVTSGQSNPWDTPPDEYREDALSGAGVEFSIETQENGDWAIRFLLRMLAYDLLLAAGHFGEKPPFRLHDRIPIGGPLDGSAGTAVTNAILHAPESYPISFQLPSGKVEILQFIGVTDDEVDLSRSEGFEALRAKLLAEGNFPATNLHR